MLWQRLRNRVVHGAIYPRTCRDPEIRELVNSLGPGNRFKQAQELLERPRSPEDRAWLIDEFAREYPVDPSTLRWAEAEPNNPLAHTLAGTVAVHWAWRARSSAAASMITQERWQSFADRLLVADQYLTTAILLDKSDPVPHTSMMGVLMGRGGEHQLIEEHFHKAVELSPANWMAHQTMLSCSCRKWGGSEEKMRSFVGRTIARAPKGSLLHALVPALVVEEFIAKLFENPRFGTAVLNQPRFREALVRAHDAYLRCPTRQVVKRELAHRNAFAATLSWTGAHDRALEELDHLADRIMEFPWQFDGIHPRAAAKQARARALSGAVA